MNRLGNLLKKAASRSIHTQNRFSQALQVSEWVGKQSDWTHSSSERAESYFNSLSEEDKNEKTYGALLNCYAKAGQTEKSEALAQKMKEMGFASSTLFYNDIMSLYSNTGEYEKVPGVLKEMKENGVSPNNISYRICINSYGATSNIDGMEKVLEEMENQPKITVDWCTYSSVANNYIKAGLTEKAIASLNKLEEKLDNKDGLSYNHLLSHYASLGDKTAVIRIWELKKTNTKKKYINVDYITMLGSLVKLEALEDAEKLLKEWESSGNTYDFRVPKILLFAYSKRGMGEKAEEMLEKMTAVGKIPVPNGWGIVSAGYAFKNEMKAATRCMMTAFSANAGEKGWKPNPKVVYMILGWLGSKGEVGEVENFLEALKPFMPMNMNMYHALVKANVRAGKDVSGILESMKADKIDETEVMNIEQGQSRKRNHFSQALQSDWTHSSGERAVQLDMIGRVHGVESAESYFNSLSDEDKNEKTYGALLNCYAKAGQREKSEALAQKMKEMGFASSTLFYNDIMCLYSNTGDYRKVPGVLKEMKENGVSPNNISYRICINSYGATSNIDGMEKVLEEMENQPKITVDWCTYSSVANNYIKAGLTEKAIASLNKLEEKLDNKDGLSYNHLLSHYASLGDKTAVIRIWELKKTNTKKKYINVDYITMLGSLVKLEALEDAEKLLKEWESSGNTYDFRVPNVLLIAYSKRGMVEKAEEMLEKLLKEWESSGNTCDFRVPNDLLIAYSKRDMVEKAEEMLEKMTAVGKLPVPNSWGIVSAGYAFKKEMKAATRCMMRAFSANAGEKGWKPNPKFVTMILAWLGSKGEVGEVENFVEALKALKPFKPMNKKMYRALVKANVRAGKDVSGILESWKASVEQEVLRSPL